MKGLCFFVIFLLLNLQPCYSQEDRFTNDNTIREKLSFGHTVEDSISRIRKNIFYEIQIEKAIPGQDLVIITKGKTPFDDPEIKMSFSMEDLLGKTQAPNTYTCQSVGREVCIIPSEDLINNWDKNGLIVVYIQIFSRDEEKCSFSILAEYETPLRYQFGADHFIRLEQDMVKYITLEFDDLLNSTQTIQNIFISVVPTQLFLIEDQISLLGFLTEPTSKSIPDAKGVEIWDGGLGMRLKGSFSKGSKVFLKLIASTKMNFKLLSSSPQLDQDLILQQSYKGLMKEGESCLFRINLSTIENHKEKSLVIAAHPYTGIGEVQLFTVNPQNSITLPNWRSDIWGSIQIVVEKEEREKFKEENGDYYFLRLVAKQEFAYSIRAYLFEPEKLLIDFQESIQGLSIFHQVQNYRLNVDTNNPINIFVMLINILGDSDLFIMRCPQDSGINSCQSNQNDIFQYYKDVEANKTDSNSKFVVAKIGSQKREFSSFVHSQQSPTTYIISIVGQTLDVNKYILRVVNDVQHPVLQTGMPYKDSVNKFEFHFYSYKPTTSSQIEEVAFVLTPFTGQGTMRSSRENKYPRMGNYEESNDFNNRIIYYSKDYPNLQNTTFYVSVQGLADSIYTITPFIKKKEETGDDAGVFLPVGFKINVYLTQQAPKVFFYVKVPVFNGASKKADILISSSAGDILSVILDKNQYQIRNNIGKYSNNVDLNKVMIPENAFTVETILFGMITCAAETNISQPKQVSLHFSIGKAAQALPINQSTVQLLQRKEIALFEFQISEYTSHFISAQVQSADTNRVEFYVSLDVRNASPSLETNNGIFNPSIGFEISTSQIDEFCSFIKTCANCVENQGTCVIRFAGYAVEDLVVTISISNQGAIYKIREGENLSVPHPETKKFSYFILEVEPQRTFVEVEITSLVGDIQIYASIYDQKNSTYNSDFIGKNNFPTSQLSQFQSSYQSGQGSASLQITFQDKADCRMVGCKVLLSVDCQDTHFRKKEIEMMSVFAFSDKTILDIKEGYDYNVNAGATQYFKLFLREKTLNFRVEILGADAQNAPIGIAVNHQSNGLPDLSNVNASDRSYLVSTDNEFLEKGYYFIGVNSKDSPKNVKLRVSVNSNQVIHLNLDGKRRDIRIAKDETAYLLIDLRSLKEKQDLEFMIFDVASSFSVKVYANEKVSSLSIIQEIKDVEKNGIIVGEFGKIAHGIQLESIRKDTFSYVAALKSTVPQELRVILRTKNTVQVLSEGEQFNDVLPRDSYRIFDLNAEKATLQFGMMAGEIRISLLIPTKLSLPEWLESAKSIDSYAFSNEDGATNMHELVTQKHPLIAGSQKILIQAINGREALYSIRNTFTSEEKPQSETLFLSLPVLRKIRSGETQQFLIYNLQEQLLQVHLSVTFPSLNRVNTRKPNVTVKPEHSGQIIKDLQTVESSKAYFITLELSQGTFKVTISNDISLSKQDDQAIEYVISLDSSGITNLSEQQDYIGSSSSLSIFQFFQYFRGQSTPFIIQLFNCIGESTLAISDSLDAVASGASDLNIRSHQIPQQPFKMYSATEYDNSNSSLALYISARAVRLQEQSKTTMFVLNVIELETYRGYSASKSLLLKPFDELHLSSNGIQVRETRKNNIQTELKVQVEGVNCKSGCYHLRANVRSISYDLFVATSPELLQYYSVCSSHITHKQEQQQLQDKKDKLLLTKSYSTQILSDKKTIEFIIKPSELPKLSPIYVQVSAKVKIADFGRQEVLEIPLFYEPLKLSNQWWNEIEISSQKGIPTEELENNNNKDEQDSSNSGISFIIIFIIILCIVGLVLIIKAIKRCKDKNQYSIQSIFQDSLKDQELSKYHSQQ